jgi:large subunit ribosomal protein L10Ae
MLIVFLIGPGLNKAGKFPSVLPPNADPRDKVNEIASTVKFNLRIKKDRPMCMGTAVGNVSLTEDELVTNISIAVNFMVSLLKKKWQNVKRLYIKSTMGPSHKIYGF